MTRLRGSSLASRYRGACTTLAVGDDGGTPRAGGCGGNDINDIYDGEWGMNIWAVLLAAVSTFLLGGLWYSPLLFGKVWNDANGGVPPPGHPARVFGVSFVFSLVAAVAFAYLLGPAPTLEAALQLGLLVGIGFVAASFGINYQFAQRSFTLWLVDSGYHVAQFALFGLVLGLWH